jgi:hypothetical protein
LFVLGANIIERGLLNSDNTVVTSAKSKVSIPVTADKVTKLKSCKTIRVVTNILVPPGPETKIMESYEVDVNIVAELTYNVGG